MHIRLSNTLRKHIDIGRLEARRTADASCMADAAFLSVIREGMSHASHILHKLLDETKLHQLKTKLDRAIAGKPARKQDEASQPEHDQALTLIVAGSAEVCYEVSAPMFKNLDSENSPLPTANTGHFMVWLLEQKDTSAARLMSGAGLDVMEVKDYLSQLPFNEDYYLEIDILERLSRRREARAKAAGDENRDQEAAPAQRPRKGGTAASKSRARSRDALSQFGVNLSEQAEAGVLDPVVGREREIERLIQILGRRKKNNPILIGEAGVGKSAIVEGLALRISSGDIPASLAGKEIFSLDIASLVAGTKFRGEFEERIKGLIDELKRSDNTIVFIDEIHTITGAGSSQGSLDTANILKPALARGELQCIGATTLDEYRECIESDGALERRFQKIIVEPASKEETLAILSNVKRYYEKHHGVRYTDAALSACVELTARYITDRHFPDKAIDALDEAGSKARLFGVKEPDDIARLADAIDKAEQEREDMAEGLSASEIAESRIRIMAMREKLRECRADWQRERSLNPFEVDECHIEEVITSMTGIPVERVSQGEKKKLADMEASLSKLVIGQQEAVRKVVRSIQRSRTGLKDPDKPAGVFMFVGPTGMGKTHLAKELGKWMFDRGDALIRVDMSEYSEKHNVSRMIGSPPGYVGYNEGGQLTEAVRSQPYAVVLFDEIEKAHPDVFNIMLQIFDDGQLTDGNGRKVDFRNTVIIMTSNVGSRRVSTRPPAVGFRTSGKELAEIKGIESDYRHALESTFAPEFINRIDDIVIFNTLSQADVEKIVDLELRGIESRAATLGFTLKTTAGARRMLAEAGYDSRYGVRSLKRTILDMVEVPLAQMIVSEELQAGDTLRIEVRNKKVEVARCEKALARTS